MGKPCSSCNHEDRESLDHALVLGHESLRSLARRFGVDRHSLSRHVSHHLTPALTRVVTERQEAGPRSALERLEELHDEARAVLDAAKEGKQGQLSLQAVRELRGIVETIAKITGELDERARVQIVLTQTVEWQAFRDTLLAILADYPEVQARVIPALAAAGDAA